MTFATNLVSGCITYFIGNILTAKFRWQDCNGTTVLLKFKEKKHPAINCSNKSSRGGLGLEQWSDNRLHSPPVDRIPLGTVVYLCILFYSMHSIFALPGWRYECILKKGVSHFRLHKYTTGTMSLYGTIWDPLYIQKSTDMCYMCV